MGEERRVSWAICVVSCCLARRPRLGQDTEKKEGYLVNSETQSCIFQQWAKCNRITRNLQTIELRIQPLSPPSEFSPSYSRGLKCVEELSRNQQALAGSGS